MTGRSARVLAGLALAVAATSAAAAAVIGLLHIAGFVQDWASLYVIFLVVDRRFNRARYDAQREVGVFRDRLRDEVDLEQVAVGLVGTVHGTIQPAQASLWLRPLAGEPR